MAVNKKITECTAITGAPASVDAFGVVDISDTTDAASGTTKKITWLNLIKELFAAKYAADVGANDTYVATLSPAPAAYVTGEHYRFKANTANTGAATINFNGLGAKTIKKAAGGITTDLADNDIRAGQWVDLVYDGTNMQMQSILGNAPSAAGPATQIDETGDPATLDIGAIADGEYLKRDGTDIVGDTPAGTGDVVGPASATDNAIVRYNTTTGKLVQDSNLTLPDDAATTEVGYMNIPQFSYSADHTAVIGERGSHLFHPVADNNARTFTIPANASVAFPVGTAITFVNKINVLSIAITSDTLTWAEDGSTGTRALAANGIATALKITSTEWLISGTGIS